MQPPRFVSGWVPQAYVTRDNLYLPSVAPTLPGLFYLDQWVYP